MDLVLALAGFGVGVVVGLTGMGGGALMTPILVLFFGVPPLAAVSSDLAAGAVMKPFGGWVHARRGTVCWPLVGWLCAGSIPSAFAGVLLMRLVGHDGAVQDAVRHALGVALLLAAGGLVIRAYTGQGRTAGEDWAATVRVRRVPTLLLGAVGGLVVGLTSVGSGSLIIVVLLALYPALRANDLVGTDLVQAVPLVTAAALGHAFFGDLHLDVAAAVLVGSVPGVLLGARMSSRAPAGVVRAALVVVLAASALKLFGVANTVVVVVVVAGVVAFVAETLLRRGAAGRTGEPGAAAGTGRPERTPAPVPVPDPAPAAPGTG
ncbi:MAG TPA: sulfite exporter TauE/SafE family protein [Micromonosporaceae bacterium]|nr:sulfite exporter TauE/SafE family protein [Micromonosporaceae bacterium]